MVMNALRFSEESSEKMHVEGRKLRSSYIAFHDSAPEANTNLPAAYDTVDKDKTLEAASALKWESSFTTITLLFREKNMVKIENINTSSSSVSLEIRATFIRNTSS